VALERWATVGVADNIYEWFPVNFKVFSKPGPFAPIFHRWAQRFKRSDDPSPPGNTPQARRQRLYRQWTDFFFDTDDPAGRREFNDLVDLTFSAITPSTLHHKSKGLAASLPFLEDRVDFSKFQSERRLRQTFRGQLFVNAYCIDEQEMEIFKNNQIDPLHIRAALSLPFLYPPVQIGNKYYLEGAAHDPLNFDGLRDAMGVTHSRTPKPLVVLDIMGHFPEGLIRVPKNLWDAYIISVVTPIVALAKKDLAVFKCKHNERKDGTKLWELMEVPFKVPDSQLPRLLEWSYSNMQRLFEIGQQAGEEFFRQGHGARVPDRATTIGI
jgi:hypothetical protein